MPDRVINLNEKLKLFSDLWSPRIIAKMNDLHFKLAKIEDDFIWHKHDNTDEVFLVIEGKMYIDLPDQKIELKENEMFVVPAGIEHKPYADDECHVLVIETAGTSNTGDNEDAEGTTGLWI